MATKVNNPRFPHTCRIYRMDGETAFENGTERVMYEGECRKYGNSSLRTFKTSDVVKGDFALSVPGTVEGILAGDLLDVTDRSGMYEKCLITECYAGNMGTTVYFNMAKN